MQATEVSARRALLVLLIGALVLVLMVFRPLGEALFLAVVLSMVLSPIHQKLSRLFGGRERLSAGLLVAGVLILLVGPLVGLVAFMVKEGMEAAGWVQGVVRSEGASGLLKRLPEPVENLARRGLELIPGTPTENLANSVGSSGGTAAGAVGAAVTATGSMVFQTVMMLLALFFILTGKEALLNWVDDASPLRKGQTRELMTEFRRTSRAVIVSSGVTALVQAAVATIGFFIARVPFPVFFGAVAFFFALIPAVGAAIVCLLAAGLLLLTGHTIAAIFLAIWGVLVVGLVDNIVKPILIKSGMKMNGAIVFFALLGGLAAFGAIGLVIGPLAVALFLALVRIYQRDYATDPRDRAAMRSKGVGHQPPTDAAGPQPPPPAGTKDTGLHS